MFHYVLLACCCSIASFLCVLRAPSSMLAQRIDVVLSVTRTFLPPYLLSICKMQFGFVSRMLCRDKCIVEGGVGAEPWI